MLIVVRRDDHQSAVINADEMIQVVWVDGANDRDHWSIQMTHGREPDILTVKRSVAIPTTAAGAMTPDKLLRTLVGGLIL
jgi:hypothetical protein